jgi:hypothetical protein
MSMNDIWSVLAKRIGNLLSVKSIVTIAMTIVFSTLALRGDVTGKDFLTIFLSIITFYFGTQYAKDGANNGSAD